MRRKNGNHGFIEYGAREIDGRTMAERLELRVRDLERRDRRNRMIRRVALVLVGVLAGMAAFEIGSCVVR